MNFEAKIILFLQSNASTGWVSFFMAVTALASFVGVILFAGIIFFKDKKLSIAYVLTAIFTALFNLALKTLIARPRPFDTFDGIANYGREDGYSMPSSHAAIAAMTAVFVCYFAFKFSKSRPVRALTIVLMTLFVCLIMLSRMVLGVHYLSDTAAGVVEGLLMGFAGLRANNAIKISKKKVE